MSTPANGCPSHRSRHRFARSAGTGNCVRNFYPLPTATYPADRYKAKWKMTGIRKATISDSEAIIVLALEMISEPDEQGIVEDRIAKIIMSEVDNLFVFETENQIKAWIHFFIANRVTSASFVEIGGLVVSATYRRNGVGRRLVGDVIQWTKKRNLKIRVRCNTKRLNAHVFYSSLGFSNTKSQHVFEISL